METLRQVQEVARYLAIRKFFKVSPQVTSSCFPYFAK
jgi:hypothetical protein